MVGQMVRMRIGLAVASLTLFLAGCALQVPADPHGTLERVEGGVLRVGVTENAPWVELRNSAVPSGTEPALILEFAERLESKIEWSVGSEAHLMDALDRGDLDVVLGGFLDDTPWSELGAVTRPYAETTTSEGTEKHVMVVRMGENAFLVALEKYLYGTATS